MTLVRVRNTLMAFCNYSMGVDLTSIADASAHAVGVREVIAAVNDAARTAGFSEEAFKAARAASAISLAEIIRLFDGALAPTESVSKYYYESTPIEREKKLVKVLLNIRDHIANKLEKTTIANMV